MAKIVLVDQNRPRLAKLSDALRVAGHEVVVASSGSLALTALERTQPDLVVAGAESDDMTGWDLCGIMRADPSARERLFVLLADAPVETTTVSTTGVDVVLPHTAGIPEIVRALALMLSTGASDAAPGSRTEVVVSEDDALPRARSFRGSLGVMDMAEVTQAISIAGKTGRLTASLTAGTGIVWFVSGRAVHAEFDGHQGERAFHALVAAAHAESDGDFCFSPVDPDEAAGFPRTIARSVDQLLLIVAADIDERRPVVTPDAHATAQTPEEEC